MSNHMKHDRVTITVEADTGRLPGVPLACRVRRLLKAMLRSFGLRAVEVREGHVR